MIVTYFDAKPIPDRRFDWVAYDRDTYGGDPSDPIGYGETEEAALLDLNIQIEERS